MASDGCQPLGLMSGRAVAAAATAAAPALVAPRRAPTAVWYGPAPSAAAVRRAEPEPPFDPAREPRTVPLGGSGLRLPLAGVVASDADSVRCARRRARSRADPRSAALRCGCLMVSPGCEAAVGEALRAERAVGGAARDAFFLAALLPGAPADAGACRGRARARAARAR